MPLLVGLTGGIASGKSTAAAELQRLGAVLIDADRLAREVVEPGTPGLGAVAEEFGSGVLAGAALDRAALSRIVFADAAARERLNQIVHPLVRRRAAEITAAQPQEAVVLQDIPLLVENGMAADFHLVIVVGVRAEVRLERAVARGMDAGDARARIAAQADDAARRRVADVWLDNSGTPAALRAQVAELWQGRILPFARNLAADRPARTVAENAALPTVAADLAWEPAAQRLIARIRRAAGSLATAVEHIGPTAVPRPGPDLITLQVGVAGTARLEEPLAGAGFAPAHDRSTGEAWYGTADPGRPAQAVVRPYGSQAWDTALAEREVQRSQVR